MKSTKQLLIAYQRSKQFSPLTCPNGHVLWVQDERTMVCQADDYTRELGWQTAAVLTTVISNYI
jgi:hypothetical protein